MTNEIKLCGKTILMVFAHCDDELVCGWPILQDPSIKKQLLIVSSDRNNSQRAWCKHRKFVTKDLCKSLGMTVNVLDYDSDFHRLDYRSGELAKIEGRILRSIDQFSFDYIMTHNAHGEYGHLDHKFLFSLMLRTASSPLLVTDIVLSSPWTAVRPTSAAYKEAYHRNSLGRVRIDMKFYRKVMRFYDSRGVWTWSEPPCAEAGLFRL